MRKFLSTKHKNSISQSSIGNIVKCTGYKPYQKLEQIAVQIEYSKNGVYAGIGYKPFISNAFSTSKLYINVLLWIS